MAETSWSDLNEETHDRLITEFKGFVESAPLYQKHKLEQMPSFFGQISPSMLLLYCPICKREQPFRKPVGTFRKAPGMSRPASIGSSGRSPEGLKSQVYGVAKRCTGCDQAEFVSWIEVDVEMKWVRKVGQVPPWTKRVDKTLEKALGDDAELYRRALDCISRAYGLGACAYLRRVVEHQIDPLLRLIYDVHQEAGADEPKLEEIQRTIKGKNFDEKARLAYRVAPSTLIVEGTNPIKIIYDRFSVGLHSLDEETAVQVAGEIATALEYVVVELNRQRNARMQFAEKVKSAFKFGA